MVTAMTVNATQRNFFSSSAVPFMVHNRVVTAHTVTIIAPTELGAAVTVAVNNFMVLHRNSYDAY